MIDDMTQDDMKMIGCDGIRRSFDEHFDTMMVVEQDPLGAHHAIHNQHARIEELEAKLAKAVEALERIDEASNHYCMTPTYSEGTLRYAHKSTRNLARTTLAELKGEK